VKFVSTQPLEKSAIKRDGPVFFSLAPVKVEEKNVSGVMYQVSCIRCHVSGVMYQVSCIRCQVSGVRCQVGTCASLCLLPLWPTVVKKWGPASADDRQQSMNCINNWGQRYAGGLKLGRRGSTALPVDDRHRGPSWGERKSMLVYWIHSQLVVSTALILTFSPVEKGQRLHAALYAVVRRANPVADTWWFRGSMREFLRGILPPFGGERES
jgi:hypothetical protein